MRQRGWLLAPKMKDLPAAATQPGSRSLKDGARTRVVAGGRRKGRAPEPSWWPSPGVRPTVAGPVGQQGGHPEPFVFPARKQLPKRTFQDVLKEQGARDGDPETKKRRRRKEVRPWSGGRKRGEAHSVCLWWWGSGKVGAYLGLGCGDPT